MTRIENRLFKTFLIKELAVFPVNDQDVVFQPVIEVS